MLLLLACAPEPAVHLDPAEPELGELNPLTPSGLGGNPRPVLDTSVDGFVVDLGDPLREPSEWIEYRAHPTRSSFASVDQNGVLEEIALRGEPTDFVIHGGAALVTLRSDGQLARVTLRHGMELDERIDVGAEPTAIVSTRSAVYVALQQEHAVVELDGATLKETRRFETDAQTRWLQLNEAQSALIAIPSIGNDIVAIDLETGELDELELPELQVWSPNGNEAVNGIIRFTGRPDMDDKRLVVPALVVENTTTEAQVPAGYYTPGTWTAHPGRFTPAVLVWDVDEGLPVGEPAAVALLNWRSGDPMDRSYPSHVELADDGRAWIAMPGASSLVQVGLQSARTPSGFLAFKEANTFVVSGTGEAEEIRLRDDYLLFFGRSGWVGTVEDFTTAWGLKVGHAGQSRATATTAPDFEQGRSLFQTTTSRAMVQQYSGVTCDTCHFEGRTDGLTWPLKDGDHQTPSLAGTVSATGPFSWAGDVATIEDELYETSTDRMGGWGVEEWQAEKIAAWIDFTPPVALPDQDPEAVARGEAIFEDLGCADCHVPPLYTDQTTWEMFEVEVDTPSLLGVAATAPYLHDGRAETLEDAVIQSTEGGMADTSELTDEEIDDLVAFLASLEE